VEYTSWTKPPRIRRTGDGCSETAAKKGRGFLGGGKLPKLEMGGRRIRAFRAAEKGRTRVIRGLSDKSGEKRKKKKKNLKK